MNKLLVKRLFEKHIFNSKMNVIKDIVIEDGIIDYEIFLSDKRYAIKVKGSRSDEYSTIGQLLSIKRTYSHVFLLAPISFLKKIWKILKETNTLTDIGFMTVNNNGLYIIKYPNPESYFYKPPVKPKTPVKKYMRINEIDILIESRFKNQIFTISDIAKTLNIPMANVYHRISRLKAAGMIEEVSNGLNPKSYKFIKSRSLDEMINIQ